MCFAWPTAGRSSTRSPAPRNYPPVGNQRAFTLPNASRHYNSVSCGDQISLVSHPVIIVRSRVFCKQEYSYRSIHRRMGLLDMIREKLTLHSPTFAGWDALSTQNRLVKKGFAKTDADYSKRACARDSSMREVNNKKKKNEIGGKQKISYLLL